MEMGAESGSPVLLSGLPLRLGEEKLKAELREALLASAPFQIQLLSDWSTGTFRGAACVAFG